MNEDLERTIIGEFITATEEKQKKVLENIGTSYFQQKEYGDIVRVASDIMRDGLRADLVSMCLRFKENNKRHLIAKATDSLVEVYSSEYLMQHVELLIEQKNKRQIFSSLKSGYSKLKNCDDNSSFQKTLEQIMMDLQKYKLNSQNKLTELKDVKEQFNTDLDNKTVIDGYSTGLKQVDAVTSGFSKTHLTVIGGLKKSGKTRFTIFLTNQLINQKVKVGYLSLEMTSYEFITLMTSHITKISDFYIRRKTELTKTQIDTLKECESNYNNISFIESAGFDINKICSSISELSEQGCGIIFIDHLQRINFSGKSNNKVQEIEEGCQIIADLTRNKKVHIILLSQLNTEAENDKPSIKNFKWGGGPAEAADTILLFDNVYRRTKNKTDKNLINLIIEQRYGESADMKINSDLGTCSFFDQIAGPHPDI
jgi:replicative DNA helicase